MTMIMINAHTTQWLSLLVSLLFTRNANNILLNQSSWILVCSHHKYLTTYHLWFLQCLLCCFLQYPVQSNIQKNTHTHARTHTHTHTPTHTHTLFVCSLWWIFLFPALNETSSCCCHDNAPWPTQEGTFEIRSRSPKAGVWVLTKDRCWCQIHHMVNKITLILEPMYRWMPKYHSPCFFLSSDFGQDCDINIFFVICSAILLWQTRFCIIIKSDMQTH